MIDAAERLVAERGIAAVSARDVLVAAGQRNKAAVSYHFGSWDGLVAATLDTRMAEVAQRRTELSQALDDATTRQLVEVLILPLAERCVCDPDSFWARFLYRCMSDPGVGALVEASVEGQSFRSARARLVDHIDHVPAPLRRRRVQTAFATAVSSLAEFETRRDDDRDPSLPIEVVLSDLIDMTVAIVDSPPSPSTSELISRGTHSTAATNGASR